MGNMISFACGFVAGWAIRSVAESSRDVTVRAIRTGMSLADRLRLWWAVERELLQDLVSEARDAGAQEDAAREAGGQEREHAREKRPPPTSAAEAA
jgi:hypothetical protein